MINVAAIFDCNNTSLRKNSNGENVKTLQTHLKTLGYYNSTLDGSFGPVTESAVKAFQRAYKLDADGWFGPQTCKKFNQVMESKSQTDTAEKAVKKFDCPKVSLKEKAKGEEVKLLQSMLKALGYYTRQIDGDFGPKTTEAVKAFQKATNHDADGWFGPKTCPDLQRKYNEKISTTKKATAVVDPTPPYLRIPYAELTILPEVVVLPEVEINTGEATKTSTGGSITTETNFDCTKINLKSGSQGEDVKKLQTILKARGYYTRQVDGDYGQYTVAAVKKLQQVQGNSQDGEFGPKTCQKLQGTTTTNQKKKVTYNNILSLSISDDVEGISHELTIKIPYTTKTHDSMRKLQKTSFTLKRGETVYYTHEGYINDIKITHENDMMSIELSIVGYTVFLDQNVEFEKTAKRSELIKELITLAGLKPDVQWEGLNDDEFTLKATITQTNTEGGGGGLTTISGNDCTDTHSLSAYSFDINTCKGNTKIGNSSANYAQDTKNMTAKQAIQDLFRRFKYYYPMYANNRWCPQKMWNKNGTIYGNCADAARIVKAVGEVHGLKVGIHHWSSGNKGHYFNVIEVNGKTYRFDLCFKSSGYSRGYGGELCNNLTMNGGPWVK